MKPIFTFGHGSVGQVGIQTRISNTGGVCVTIVPLWPPGTVERKKLLIIDDFNFHMEYIDSSSVKNMTGLLLEFGVRKYVTGATSKDANQVLI